ncbi:hypothetical protein [Gordonia sp. C13]|uniref:hypothetical protein n=1 Tax=Gordonia sp. C13 TaxID=2935078 RepID=UPI00200B963F|nr:hypothetical protein [Gordonia sp. C13]MCK8613799.1 hypothetical protein [Gordonia sp. C13]
MTDTVNDRSATRVAPLIPIEQLADTLDGRQLPGASLTLEEYESALADYALEAEADDSGHAHPLWLLILALRGMGISVNELCDLAAKRPQDTLLFGTCELNQHRPLSIGRTFTVSAKVRPVSRKTSRAGGVLDFVTIDTIVHADLDGKVVGDIVTGYIFKREA